MLLTWGQWNVWGGAGRQACPPVLGSRPHAAPLSPQLRAPELRRLRARGHIRRRHFDFREQFGKWEVLRQKCQNKQKTRCFFFFYNTEGGWLQQLEMALLPRWRPAWTGFLRRTGPVGQAAGWRGLHRGAALSPGFPRQCCPQGGGEPASHLPQRRLHLEGDSQRV